jgi:hypothetical protein
MIVILPLSVLQVGVSEQPADGTPAIQLVFDDTRAICVSPTARAGLLALNPEVP